MAKKEKKKKENTSKETFVEKISKNNTKSLPPKNKKFAYLVGASLVTFVTLGIGIPVGLASQQISSTNPPAINDDLITFNNSKGEKETLTVGQFQEQFQLLNTETQQGNVSAIQNYFYQYLYQAEYNASVQYQEILNKTNPAGSATVTKIALKPFEEIVSEQTDDLNSKEQNVIDNNPAGTARTTALQKLWKDSFDGALTHDQALQNSITKIIKKDALRRFNVSEIAPLSPSTNGTITTDGFNSFSQYDLSNRKLSEDVVLKNKTVINADGTISFENGSTTLKSGENPFNSFLQGNTAIQNVQPNNSQFNQNSQSSQLAVFTNNSFDIDQKNPKNNIENYLKNRNAKNVSTLTINATQNTKSSILPWTVTSEVLTKLFSFTNNSATNEPILNIELMKNWKGANGLETNQEQRKNDAYLLTNVSDNKEKNALGSNGIQDMLALLKSQEANSTLPLLENIYQPSEQDVIGNLIQEIQTNLFAKAGIDITDINSFTSSTTSNSQKIIEANTLIKSILSGDSGILSADDVKKIGGSAFRDAFATRKINESGEVTIDAQKKASESYLLPNGNIVTLSTTGININSISDYDTLSSYQNAISSDLQFSANSVFAKGQNISFNTNNTYASLKSISNLNESVSDQKILKNFLTTPSTELDNFKKYLLLKENTSLTTNKANFTSENIESATKTLIDFINSENIKRSVDVQSKVSKYIDSQINSSLKSDYIFESNQWNIAQNNSTLDAVSTAINTITQQATNIITLENSSNLNSDILFEGSSSDFKPQALKETIYNITLNQNSSANFFDPNILNIKNVSYNNGIGDNSMFSLSKTSSQNSNNKQTNEYTLSLVDGKNLAKGTYKITLEAKIATSDFSNNINAAEKSASVTKTFVYTINII